MVATISHVLVALDGTVRDHEVAAVAGRLATAGGVSLALVLPRTPRVTTRLSAFAASAELTPADAAQAYVEPLARCTSTPLVVVPALHDESTTRVA